MIIAFTTQGKSWESSMDPRFGRTAYFLIYNDETKEINTIDNSANAGEAHGAGPKAAQMLYEEKINVLITGNGPGGNALSVLEKMNADIYIGAGDMTVAEAYNAYKQGQLVIY